MLLQGVEVIEAKVHPNYTNFFQGSDIALLELKFPLRFDQTMSPICLSNPDQVIPDEANVVATGFGGTGGPNTVQHLRETIMPIHSKDECSALWTESLLPELAEYPEETHKEIIDALSPGKTICAGSIAHKIQNVFFSFQFYYPQIHNLH
ncbi:hypothetical protein PENTCL1PPCAC_29899 [Pristionchus entomophagus]|uniref:Peptidase S1 domain-containing protein n=1 Tax=Pristionchus entomophagus TaxID=358040 RepID=A0AAV5UP14_9BILA|nr:hypothetical protein PENTCL1PPCAC_29899 [Pristionchus entomophagus]